MNGKITYRQQYTRCGKQRCRKCREGTGHGPYWYAYWSESGRTVSKYIGVTLPEHVELDQVRQRPIENPDGSSSSHPSLLSPTIRVYLLGQFRVEHRQQGEWRPVDSRTWHRRRARALLGCLVSSTGRRMGREQVMEQLWPDLEIDLAANRLNGAVHELRQILEPDIARPATSRMLRLERDILELADASQIWVDAEEFESRLKKAEAATSPEEAEVLLERAAELYRGNYLLEELYSEWAASRRDVLQRAWVGLLLKLADLRAEKGAFVSAIETLDRLRMADPTNETALQRLMILLTQLDRRGEALRVYSRHRDLLQDEYDGEPLPETTELYEALCTGFVPEPYTSKVSGGASKERVSSGPSIEVNAPQELSLMRPSFQLGRHKQSPLIGRDRELETMRQVLLAIESVKTAGNTTELAGATSALPAIAPTRPRHIHFLLLRGEPGIGKTRLAEELSLEAYRRDWSVAWSRSYEQERTIPYRPWTELLRTLLQSTSTDPAVIATRLGMTSTAISKLERLGVLLPELMAHTAKGSSPPARPHEHERLHLWEAALSLLSAFSRFHPLLLVFDDLHWADDSSIELLTYLTHHLQEQRILLVGTCRDGELAPQHTLRRLTVDLQREQTIAIVPVQPLTTSQIGTLFSHLPREIVRSIQGQASGNPFFAEELARYMSSSLENKPLVSDRTVRNQAVRSEQASTTPDRSLPEGIAAVLERRLSRLSSGCQALLGRAAVLGGSFELSQLLPMATEYNEDNVLDLLDEALDAGLLTEEGTGAHITYHFWHPLIISHLYGRLSAARRAQLHRRAAEAIKAANVTNPEKGAATVLHHLSKGGAEPATVAYYAELAGNQAFLLGAYSEGQQHYLHAISALLELEPVPGNGQSGSHTRIQQITSELPSRSSIADPLRVGRLLERVAECGIVLGNFGECRQIYESVLALRTSEHFLRRVYGSLSPTGNELQHEAQIQGLIRREIGITWSSIGEYRRAYASFDRGKEIMARAGVTSGAAWACLHLQYGATFRIEGNYHEARRYLQEALTILERVVQQSSALEQTLIPEQSRKTGPLTANAIESAQPLPSRELPTRTERALRGDPLELGYAHERLGIVDASLGQPDDALQHLHTALAIYEQSELVSVMARVCGNLGAVYITRGEHQAARDYMQRALNLAERAGNIPSMAFIMHNLGDVSQRSGSLREAAEWFTRSLALSERLNDREHISWCYVALAAVQVDQEKFTDAAASIGRAISIGREIKSMRCICYALVGLADLRISQAFIARLDGTLEDEQAMQQSHRLLLRARSTLQRAISIAGMEVENIIDGKHLLALVYFLLNDQDTAQQMAQQILKESLEHQMTRITGRTYRLLGRILVARGEYEQAGQYFQQSMQVCRERGLRLEYARTLHNYGLALFKYPHPFSLAPSSDKTLPPDQRQSGSEYLREARKIFSECHATLDLTIIDQLEQSKLVLEATQPG